MNIIVLAGGISPEREVSLSSGNLVSKALLKNGHNVLLLDLCQDIDLKVSVEEYYYNNCNSFYEPSIISKTYNEDNIGNTSENFIGKNILKLCKFCDIVFLSLHGSIGENGKLQALFDLNNIKYTGTGYTGSLLAMDKQITKEILVANKISTPRWIFCKLPLYDDSLFKNSNLNFPVVVKPNSCGSSIGVSIANNNFELKESIQKAEKLESSIIIEEYIKGREFSIGILSNNTLPIIEIKPVSGFYDYENKYQHGKTIEVCPAEINKTLANEIQEIAIRIHELLKLGYYSRIDFIIDEMNKVYFLEANTLPGMTPTSLIPQEAKAVGISYENLCELIVKHPFI